MRKLARWAIAICLYLSTSAAHGTEFWLVPTAEAPDLLQMFTDPSEWQAARSKIGVIQMAPSQVMGRNFSNMNTISDLAKVNAFGLLKRWNIKLAFEAPAVKEWDCTGTVAAKRTLQWIDNVRKAGGEVNYIVLDEPLTAGTRLCKESRDELASKVATYLRTVRAGAPTVKIGLTEPYPWFSVSELKSWISSISEAGSPIDFFRIDINFPALKPRRADLNSDMTDMRRFLQSNRIPFSVIIWSGQNPEPSDASYYEHTIIWARLVHSMVPKPSQVVVQSWVKRGSPPCPAGRTCATAMASCGPNDPPCGKWSVPMNMPVSSQFSNTRLLNDVVAIFEGH